MHSACLSSPLPSPPWLPAPRWLCLIAKGSTQFCTRCRNSVPRRELQGGGRGGRGLRVLALCFIPTTSTELGNKPTPRGAQHSPPAKALQSSALPQAHTQRDTARPWVLLITVLAQGQQPAQSATLCTMQSSPLFLCGSPVARSPLTPLEGLRSFASIKRAIKAVVRCTARHHAVRAAGKTLLWTIQRSELISVTNTMCLQTEQLFFFAEVKVLQQKRSNLCCSRASSTQPRAGPQPPSAGQIPDGAQECCGLQAAVLPNLSLFP